MHTDLKERPRASEKVMCRGKKTHSLISVSLENTSDKI